MTPVTTSSVIRSILTENINLTADAVIQAVRRRGHTASPESIRGLVYNIRGEVKRAKAARTGSPAKPSPVGKAMAPAPRVTAPVTKAMAHARRVTAPTSKLATTSAPRPAAGAVPVDVAGVLVNVALVSRVAGLCGGVGNVRQAAEAVRACGSVDEFLQHLDVVAGITSGQAAA